MYIRFYKGCCFVQVTVHTIMLMILILLSCLGERSAFHLLNSKKARQEWEKEFVSCCIQPILNRLEAHLDNARSLLARDDTQGLIHDCTI